MFKSTFFAPVTSLDLTIKQKPLQLKNFINSFALVYGVNQKRLLPLIKFLGIHSQTKIKDLTDCHFQQIKFFFEHTDSKYILSDFYREKYLAIKQLINMKCYKGIRHQKHLPVRGQRTHSNSRTAKRVYLTIVERVISGRSKQQKPVLTHKKPIKSKKKLTTKKKNK